MTIAARLNRPVAECIVAYVGEGRRWDTLTPDELEALEEALLERIAIQAEAGSKECLLVFDGCNVFFRAAYAAPAAAAQVFLQTVAKTIKAIGPAMVLIVWDAGGDTGRRQIFPAYKAHRSEHPHQITAQIPAARRAIDDLGLRRVESPEIEADDLIASYVRAATDRGHRVVIVTSDKDMMQLVQDGVDLYDTTKAALIGTAEVERRWGVPPCKLGDLLALAGDNADNVPGVPGIGEKTAAQLLAEHGDLEGILAAAPGMSQPKRRARLIAHADAARLSRRLVELQDVPLPVPLEALWLPSRPAQRQVRKVYFHPDPTSSGRIPIAALESSPQGVSLHELPCPSHRACGGASKRALLEMELRAVRDAGDFSGTPANPHIKLGPICYIPATEDVELWASLPLLVDPRHGPLPLPSSNIGPGTPLGSHPYSKRRNGDDGPGLYRRWLYAQIQGGGRALDQLRGLEPGEHLECIDPNYGRHVVRAWAFLRKHNLLERRR